MLAFRRTGYITKCCKNIVHKNISAYHWLRGCWSRRNIEFIRKRNYATEASITLENAFKLHNLETGPETTVTVTAEQAKTYYTQMQIIRRLETAASTLYKAKAIRGFCHLYSGQEAGAVGMKAAMRPQDNIITSYRCHGWSYVMGISPEAILAELCGFQNGVQRGKGGSMHMYCKHFYGGNGIVGGQIPMGTGIALMSKYKKDNGVCLACYGDGAANQGQVYESYNIACLWKLPVVFVCENNIYGMGTKAERSSCNTNYYTHGNRIPGVWVDGMNILAVRSATNFAIEFVQKNGPLLVEVYTYRYTGHSMSDPGTSYRSREEIQEVRQKRDPINTFKELCLAANVLKEDDIKAVDSKTKAEITKAAAAAKGGKEVPPAEIAADIYSKNLEPAIRNVRGYTLKHLKINKGANQ